MRCPQISELPPPPKGRTGWPWTMASPNMPDVSEDGILWPKLSIMTPSYNQSEFIEETIRSVLLQGYPNIEYIIIDGGSNDNSVAIIEKYDKWLHYWVSEQDKGQSNAINKGWRKATGDIFAWINSDDFYDPNAFKGIAEFFAENEAIDMLYGDCKTVDKMSNFVEPCPTCAFNLQNLVRNKWFISQPATFFRDKVVHSIGQVNEELHLVMDWEYFLRIALNNLQICYFPWPTSNFRIYEDAKTSSQSVKSGEEKIAVLKYLFHRSKFRINIKTFKNRAFSDVYRWASNRNSENGFMGIALKYIIIAIWYQPKQLLQKRWIVRIIFIFRCYLSSLLKKPIF